ncbi:MAG: DUF937 domain-containing protein, partial [Pirellulales bacterium]
MNLVKLVTDQISSDALAKLCSILGIDRDNAESAISAAVPTMLAGLGGLAAQDDGVRKLSGALGNLDENVFGSFDRLISGDAASLRQKGGGLLNSLLGEGLTGGIASAISRYTGIAPETIKGLLAYLAPVVIGRVASQWQNLGGTPAALKNLFADQKRYIDDALPAGFSLSDVSGLGRMSELSRTASHAAKRAETAPRSVAATLIPLALLLAGAILIWNVWKNRPAPPQAEVKPAVNERETVVAMKPVAPDNAAPENATPAGAMAEIGSMHEQLTKLFQSLDTSFAEIKDAASAEAAVPKLEQIVPQLDQFTAAWQRLPATGRATLTGFLNDNFTKLKQ